MKVSERIKLVDHYNKYFEQENSTTLPSAQYVDHKIDVLRYPPTEKYPFWKLATLGASDYKMPRAKDLLGDRNEYVMFIAPDLSLEDRGEISLFKTIICLQIITLTRGEIDKLLEVAPQRYSDLLYPDCDEASPHFLCDKKRMDKF